MWPALRRGEENPTPDKPPAPTTARPRRGSLVRSRTEEGSRDDRSTRVDQAIRRQGRHRRPDLHGAAGDGDGLPGTERGREVDHHADDPGAGRTHQRVGDPRTVILDEPVKGLDTEGIRWIRSLLQGLAAEGRTVFVSSHLMSEMALTAQHLIVIGRGRLIADTGMEEFVARAAFAMVRVRSTDPAALAALLRSRDVAVSEAEDGALAVSGLSTDQVGRLAGAVGITLLELTPQQASLEEAFIDLTRDAVEFRAPTTRGAQP